MELERRHAPVPGELLEYLRANPSAAQQAADGGVHVHVHHHYAPPMPAPAGEAVHQGPQPSAAEKILPWLWVALLGCIVLTICAAVLAAVMLVVVAVLAALVLLGLVVAFIINSQSGTIAARGKAALDTARAEARMDGLRERR